MNYESWEYGVGHHDELTDIFSLGMFLANPACGLAAAREAERLFPEKLAKGCAEKA